MAEWFKAHAWKVCILSGIVGSNPTLSAIYNKILTTYGIMDISFAVILM